MTVLPTVKPGTPYTTAIESPIASGLVGTLQIEVLSAAGGPPVEAASAANIQESPAGSGLYDSDRTAPAGEGTYFIDWIAPGGMRARDVLVVSRVAQPSLGDPDLGTDGLPSVAQVAALVRARTRDHRGNELGTFTADTRPTDDEVVTLITAEAGITGLRTGDLAGLGCPSADAIRAGASQIIAKRVAAIIEASYRPDEVAEGRTVADFYSGSMKDDLEALASSARECRSYQDGDDPSDGSPSPRWAFPPARPLGRW